MDRLGGKKTLKVSNFLDTFEKDDIKKKIDIVSLFEYFGVKLTRKGRNYTGLCPFHKDKNPSLSVDKEKGLYNCFGCGESGDHFTLVEKLKGYGFKESLFFLKDFSKREGAVVLDVPEGESSETEESKRAKPTETGLKETEDKYPDLTLNTISEYYHKILFSNRKAVNYLEKRGLKSPEIFKRFEIGFADGNLSKKTSNGQMEKLKELGIVRETGVEHFNNCIVFPVRDETGTVTEIYGRSTTAENKNLKHLYLKGKHKGVWGIKAAKVYDEIIITESIIDALSLIQLGIENVQSVYGTGGFTEEHLKVLKDNRVRTIITALDSDDAGRAASEKLKAKLLKEGFTVKVIFPPGHKDWNEELKSGIKKETVLTLIEESETFKSSMNKTFKAEREGIKHIFYTDKITYRLLGVKEVFVTDLKVIIRAEYEGLKDFDNVNLYSSRSRSAFAHKLSSLFGIPVPKIETNLINIVEYLEDERDRNLKANTIKPDISLSCEERKTGMDFLCNPDIFEEILSDLNTMGCVGEDVNKVLVYAAATSRITDEPISLVVLSESSAGKSYLIDTVKKLIPEEDVLSITSLSDQALNYLPPGGLMHKFLVMGEAVHSESVEHQIRDILSARKLIRLVVTKDDKTGSMISRPVSADAIVSMAMTSTNYNLNPENLSRCFIINSDESGEQTRRIFEIQRKKYSGDRYFKNKYVIPEIIGKHHAAQRLLKRRNIKNPFTEYLDFPDSLMRLRRDHERFIDLIACVCFIRQYQKEEKEEVHEETGESASFIECDIKDYETAYRIIKSSLPLTLMNLPKGAIELYRIIRELLKVKAGKEGIKPLEAGISQREIRESAGLSQMFVKRNIRVLVEYEYLRNTRKSSRGARGIYGLIRDDDIPLIDLSMIPDPVEMKKRIKKVGHAGQSGSDPLLGT